MKSLSAYLNEDSNQFGPGTDLIVSILAVLLVMTLISSYLYTEERHKNDHGGDFRLAAEAFPAADFQVRPVTRLVDPARTNARVQQIVADYRRSNRDFAFIFVIGHSNALDDPSAEDKSREARLQRNWDYAFRRASSIATLIQEHLSEQERDRLVVMTTGEFDLRLPAQPHSQENAWVEVVFGRNWKPPSRVDAMRR